MKRILIALSACAFAFSACTDLTENVYSSLTSASYNYSQDDLRKVLGACYTPMRSYIGHGQLWAMDCTSSDEIVMPPNSTGWDDGGIYRRMHYHKWNSEQSHVRDAWNTTWQGIGLCNNLLAQLKNNDLKLDDATNKAAIAETRALRAFYYSIIVDCWGDAPLVTEPTQELPSNARRADIYNFVVTELTEAIPDLSEVSGGAEYGLFNKWAATTLLAKMYLNAGVYVGTPNWQGALDACDAVIGSHKFDLAANYSDNFKDDDAFAASNKEIILNIPFDTSLGSYSMYFFSWGAPMKSVYNTGGSPWGAGSAMGVPQFIETYDPDDSRLDDTWVHGLQYSLDTKTPVKCIYDAKDGTYPDLCYVNDIQSGDFTLEWEGYRMKKFEVKPGTNGMGTDFPLFRYAEVLLMKAECLLRLNKPGAGELVSQVRARAFKANPAKATVTDAQLKENSCYNYYYYADDYAFSKPANRKYGPHDKDKVELGRLYDEYGWEFAWEMGVRTRMIRFGTYTNRNWLSHEALGDYTALFPIPFAAITANPKLEQNPAYK
ncbi:MAG: RagB/SusD family nutrient uptake outer membrane protein [Bacteroidales bacterium]|nr:RagB/SusD family nutrient uptake outer membrane protein [Candidatus Cryptobacteroides choladohippi]MCQ2179116.1 RagB/SusD family nutrient uptake outer membrane protein [Bacteroidales bacterium]